MTNTSEPTLDCQGRSMAANLVERVAIYLAAIKFPEREWADLKTSTSDRLKKIAAELIDEISAELQGDKWQEPTA